MRVYFIGLGGAGARIVDRIHQIHADRSFVHAVACFDTDRTTLDGLESVPADRRHRFGDGVDGPGLVGDIERGFALGTDHATELCRELDAGRPGTAEAFLLVTGLGGGTGGGATPALAAELTHLYEHPVYAFGVLPGPPDRDPLVTDHAAFQSAPDKQRTGDSTDATRATAAIRSLDRLEGAVDAIIGFDSAAWLRSGESMPTATGRLNDIIAERIAATFADPDGETASQRVIDAADIGRILGRDGTYATIGYAEQKVIEEQSRFGLGLFSTTQDVDTSSAIQAVEVVTRKATRGKQTATPGIVQPSRALLVVGGPPAWLIRSAIADGRAWLADELDVEELLSGDRPNPDMTAVFATVVRAGLDSLPRIETLRTRATV